jgi:PPOX class probable FMN-dependent enzyme
MIGKNQFSDFITTEEQLREVIGYPGHRVTAKAVTALDDYCRDYIAKSPFLLIASSDAQGNVDVSPKGDPPGFVHVLDDTTLLIPDRPGNRRADTFMNVLQNPKIGLIFLIPGKKETLRVSGQATLIRDSDWRQKLSVKGKVPDLLLAVSVKEAFFHCSKCIIRSELWNSDGFPELAGLPSLAQTMVKHGNLDDSVEEMAEMIEEDAATNLY